MESYNGLQCVRKTYIGWDDLINILNKNTICDNIKYCVNKNEENVLVSMKLRDRLNREGVVKGISEFYFSDSELRDALDELFYDGSSNLEDEFILNVLKKHWSKLHKYIKVIGVERTCKEVGVLFEVNKQII